MSVPTLPKGKVAILVMDCQNDIVHENGKFGGALTGGAMPRAIKEKNVFGNIKKLMIAGRAAQVPIIHVRHVYRPDYADVPGNIAVLQAIKNAQALQEGTWGAEIHADLTPEPSDWIIAKTRVSSFYASPLEGILQAQGITHLVLTGIATDGVVEGTARDGADRGYHIIIPNDCCAATSEEAHRVILGGILSHLTTVCTSDEVVQALK
ncbi:MAG: cysteine hydrolase family protein [Candidatus Binatia bacterium]